ncbi:MAG: N-acetyltransferase family protein [Sulfitobacter sp.]
MIRLAEPTDAVAIAGLWNQMIRASLATFTTLEKTPEEIDGLIRDRAGTFWVAAKPLVIGFVTFGAFRPGPGYAATVEHTVILAPQAQGKGIGRSLMQIAMETAHRADHHIMIAGISSANPQAVAFHTALGFTQTGYMPQVGRKGGEWLDLILMQKTLGAP